MKYIPFLTFIFTFQIHAQTLRGTIYDKKTSKPVPFAAIGIKGSSTGTISNTEGAFTLKIRNQSDSIIISHLNYGYNLYKIDRKSDKQIFQIDPIEFELDEVVITNKPISEFLYQAIEKSERQLSLPIFLNTYYREFVKTNDNYTKFSDGIITYSLSRKGKNNLKTKIWVSDSRAIELYDEREEDIDWDLTSPLDVRSTFEPSLTSSIGKFMSPKNSSKYEFAMKSRKMKNEQEWNIISITPKKDLEEMLYKATVAIDTESGLIMEVDYELSESHKAFAKEINVIIVRAKLLESRNKIVFSKTDSEYNVIYTLKDRTMKIWNKKRVNEVFRFTSDLSVTGISPDPDSLNKDDEYKKKSLYKRLADTKTEFWLNSNAIELTEEQQRIINSLK